MTLDRAWIDRWVDAINHDPASQNNGRGFDASFTLVIGATRYTFSGIAVYHPRLFADCEPGKFSVVPLLRAAMRDHLVTGELYRCAWDDIGTLERLEVLRRTLASSA